MRPSIVWIAALVLAAFPRYGGAQVIEGRLVDRESGEPIEGAFVVGMDHRGHRIAGSLTDAEGAFRFQLADSGTYRLTAHRIGYQSVESPPLRVRAGATLTHVMRVGTQAVELGSLEVTAERRCSLMEGAGVALDRIWGEARKAMTLAEWTRSSGVLEMQLADYELVLDPETLEVMSRTSTDRPYFGQRPYQSLPAERLEADGYVSRRADGTYYFAPDESVLLSDSFLRTHCFRALRDPDRPGQIGLAFEPTPDRQVPDIEGAFWLDEETAELRVLEYRYSRLLEDVEAPEAGGRVEFQRLEGGAWIVSRWGIRMPELAIRADRRRRPDRRDRVLTGYREKGGEVVRTVSQAERRAEQRGVIEGRVEHRETGVGLSNATVFLSGTQYRAITDRDGRFRLVDLPVGSFPLTYRHPSLEAHGGSARSIQVELVPGEVVHVTLYYPPAGT